MTAPAASAAGSRSRSAGSVVEPISLEDLLRADAAEPLMVSLPYDHRRVPVQRFVRHETPWGDALPPRFQAVPNKAAYTLDRAPYYPELLIARLFQAAGWEAAWHKRWNGDAYWRALADPIELPDTVRSVLDQVAEHAGTAGQWEILAWRDRQLRLLTSRQGAGQLVGAYQAAWLDVALRMGIPLSWFAAVEHRVTPQPRRRKLPLARRATR
jgi:hypothetical protein